MDGPWLEVLPPLVMEAENLAFSLIIWKNIQNFRTFNDHNTRDLFLYMQFYLKKKEFMISLLCLLFVSPPSVVFKKREQWATSTTICRSGCSHSRLGYLTTRKRMSLTVSYHISRRPLPRTFVSLLNLFSKVSRCRCSISWALFSKVHGEFVGVLNVSCCLLVAALVITAPAIWPVCSGSPEPGISPIMSSAMRLGVQRPSLGMGCQPIFSLAAPFGRVVQQPYPDRPPCVFTVLYISCFYYYSGAAGATKNVDLLTPNSAFH